MTKQFLDMNAAPEPYSYVSLFAKNHPQVSPAPKPKAADMTYEQGVLALYQHGALSRDYLEQTSARNELTQIAKHVATERGCDFNTALDYVLNNAKPMADFAGAITYDPSTKAGRDAIHAAVLKDMENSGKPFTHQYAETLARLSKEGNL